MLQPLTHKIKRASARSSHMCPLPYPLLPLHSMLRVAKLFPFGGGVIKNMFISTTLIRGVIGDCVLYLLCWLLLNIYCSRVAQFIISTVPSLPSSLCFITARCHSHMRWPRRCVLCLMLEGLQNIFHQPYLSLSLYIYIYTCRDRRRLRERAGERIRIANWYVYACAVDRPACVLTYVCHV